MTSQPIKIARSPCRGFSTHKQTTITCLSCPPLQPQMTSEQLSTNSAKSTIQTWLRDAPQRNSRSFQMPTRSSGTRRPRPGMIRIEERCSERKNRGERPLLRVRQTGADWWSSWFSLAWWSWQLRCPITRVGNMTREKERREGESRARMTRERSQRTAETSTTWLKREKADGTSK